MNEKFEGLAGLQEVAPEQAIERAANYEGNETVLFLNRLGNPTIKSQLVDFIYSAESSVDRDRQMTKEEVADSLERRIAVAADSTYVFDDSTARFPYHSENGMIIGRTDELTGEPETAKQMSITEAHEKGHYIRPFSGQAYVDSFKDCLDPSGFKYPEDDWLRQRAMYERHGAQLRDEDRAEYEDRYVRYLSEPKEVVERMSQMKNYFGFGGDEQFTPGHLEHARRNYVKDTGLDNGMTAFFSLVTPDTEDEFLRIMNSIGV